MVGVNHFRWVLCVCHSSGAVVCPKDMPYGLTAALLFLSFAASLLAFHMQVFVCVASGRCVKKEWFGHIVDFFLSMFKALVVVSYVEVQ